MDSRTNPFQEEGDDVNRATKAGAVTTPRAPGQETSTRAPDKENLMPVQPRDLRPSEDYTGPRPTPAPPPEPWRDKAPSSGPRPSLGPSPAPSPDQGRVPKLGPMPNATSSRPTPAPKDIPKVPWEEGSKQNSKGLDRTEEGRELNPTPEPSPCPDATEKHFWPSLQLARAFWEIQTVLDSLNPQEHSPTNGAQFGGELKEIQLDEVRVKHGWSIKERSPDADPRLHMIGAVIRPPPEPDPRKDA